MQSFDFCAAVIIAALSISIGNGHFHKTWDQEINLEKPQKNHQPVVIAFTFSTP